jgi:hypothetical protein
MVNVNENFSLNIVDEIITNKNEKSKFKQKASATSSPS